MFDHSGRFGALQLDTTTTPAIKKLLDLNHSAIGIQGALKSLTAATTISGKEQQQLKYSNVVIVSKRMLYNQTRIPPTESKYSKRILHNQTRISPTQTKRNYCDFNGINTWNSRVTTQLQKKGYCTQLATNRRVKKARLQLPQLQGVEYREHFLSRIGNCTSVIEEFQHNYYVSAEEEGFPLAFIFVVYTNAQQVIRLLKAIYRPHNLYCIHPDARQGRKFAYPFHQISKCLPNVFVASKLTKVYYGHHTIMDAQLNCIRDLVNYHYSKWKYVINICGRELPLKTNREIVASLKALNGSSALGDAKRLTPYWWKKRFVYKCALNSRGEMQRTNRRLGHAPRGIRIHKSMNFMAASSQFAFFVLKSKKAIALRRYLRDVYAPEEHFYSSLYALPEAPGGRPKKGTVVPIVDQFIWITNHYATKHAHWYCKGWVVHSICVLGSGDLPIIYKRGLHAKKPHFFFNKYFLERNHVVMDCMEERLAEQNIKEYEQDCR